MDVLDILRLILILSILDWFVRCLTFGSLNLMFPPLDPINQDPPLLLVEPPMNLPWNPAFVGQISVSCYETSPQEAWAQGLPPRATWPRIFVSSSLVIYSKTFKNQKPWFYPDYQVGWRELFGAIVVSCCIHIPQKIGERRSYALSFSTTWQMFYDPNMKDMQACSNFCLRPIPGLNSWRAKSCHSWNTFLNCLILFEYSRKTLAKWDLEWVRHTLNQLQGVFMRSKLCWRSQYFIILLLVVFFLHFVYPSRVVLKVHV